MDTRDVVVQSQITNRRSQIQRLRVALRGAVQGVGFRPFVYRLATELRLSGWVTNSSRGVFLEVEGGRETLDEFLTRLTRDAPPQARIFSVEPSFLDPVGFDSFEIRPSEDSDEKTAFILPDLATCDDCRREIFEPRNRRFGYPFTNCTNCGPRFSIIRGLPYDRPRTSMSGFAMCPDCNAEYGDPADRRFHAQPNACPVCGPQLELWDPDGTVLASREKALLRAADLVRSGRILGLKGLGGFQLVCDARSDSAVSALRQRKAREEKPFALMFPSLEAAKEACELSAVEERLVVAPESPIVLLRKNNALAKSVAQASCLQSATAADRMSALPDLGTIAPSVAPGNPYLGIMLPYTPLHHLLMKQLGFPIVATSGNLSDEPMVTDERDALVRLRGLCDAFLVHDRPIVRHVDDSIVREIAGREVVMRRARGYAPLPVTVKQGLPRILAVGAHLKNSVAIAIGRQVFTSQHIGDLETVEAHRAFRQVIGDLCRLYDFEPEIVACDLHPDYLSTHHAKEMGLPLVQVQHHHAHVVSCMAENELEGQVLGVSWDGTGYGPDGTVWGGEFLLSTLADFRRVAHLRPFPLPGGEAAVRESRRSALSVLVETFGEAAYDMDGLPTVQSFAEEELGSLRQMLTRRLNCPLTSSAGRLFDAVSSLLGVCQRSNFEGQAAMSLEFVAAGNGAGDAGRGTSGVRPYPFDLAGGDPMVVDWRPLVHALIEDVHRDLAPALIALRFHVTLASAILAVSKRCVSSGAALSDGKLRVALSGGVFQNRLLTELALHLLEANGFHVYVHQRVPPNDGGLCLGQAVVAGAGRG